MLLGLLLLIAAPRDSALMLAGERVQFERDFTPRFTQSQLSKTNDATRAGLAKWAKTAQGKRMIAYFAAPEYKIRVTEDPSEDAAGRAPQPGIATLIAVHDHAKTKQFAIILNPRFFTLPAGMHPILYTPASAADMMAIAWAGEMLHVYFYSRGINLPHHSRADFQDQWQLVAEELGMPLVKHDD